MDVGAALLARANALGASTLAVVGTSKNAGKTVTVSAVCDALWRVGARFGVCSIGRDGEAIDAVEGTPKPRLLLRPGAFFATAEALVPRSPAVEVLDVTAERSALGAIVLVRVRAPAFVELSGPPNASASRRVVGALASLGCAPVVLDGAVDRLAALRDADDAIVIAAGAAGGPTVDHVADDAAALVARLRLPLWDPNAPALRVEGALTAGDAARFARERERRQIVVRDGTRVAFGGRAFLALAAQLDVRCEHELRPAACTVASLGPEHALEPRALLQAVAARTGLPTFDVYAGTAA